MFFFLIHLELNDKYVHTLPLFLNSHNRFQTKTVQKIFPLGWHITYMAYIREYLPPAPLPREASLGLAPHADVLGASSRVDVIDFFFLCFCHDLQYIITAVQYVVVKHFMSFTDVYICIWTVTILIYVEH